MTETKTTTNEYDERGYLVKQVVVTEYVESVVPVTA